MISFLNNKQRSPTLFLTLSAADLYWPNLLKKFGINDQSNISIYEKKKLLSENYDIAASFFKRRLESVIKYFYESKCLGEVTDHWFRIEFQNRGSPHAHGMIWIKDVKPLDAYEIGDLNDQIKETLLYVNDKIQASYPMVQTPEKYKENFKSHPSMDEFIESKDENIEKLDLQRCVHVLQKHKCSSLCLFKGKCKYKFPYQLSKEIYAVPNKDMEYDLVIKRNHSNVNFYNKDILRLWRANMDIKFITNMYAVAMYVAYYSSKSEE